MMCDTLTITLQARHQSKQPTSDSDQKSHLPHSNMGICQSEHLDVILCQQLGLLQACLWFTHCQIWTTIMQLGTTNHSLILVVYCMHSRNKISSNDENALWCYTVHMGKMLPKHEVRECTDWQHCGRAWQHVQWSKDLTHLSHTACSTLSTAELQTGPRSGWSHCTAAVIHSSKLRPQPRPQHTLAARRPSAVGCQPAGSALGADRMDWVSSDRRCCCLVALSAVEKQPVLGTDRTTADQSAASSEHQLMLLS